MTAPRGVGLRAAQFAGGTAVGAAAGLVCACTFGDRVPALGHTPTYPVRADLRRVWVVGHSGTGKTTTARRMAERIGALHIDLDELHWLPGWKERPNDEMLRMLVDQLGKAPEGRWVVSGNYSRIVGHWMREHSTALVWMRPGFFASQRQLWVRTAKRWIDGRTVCNGNVETLSNILQFNNESILYYGWFSFGATDAKLQVLTSSLVTEGRIRQEDVITLRSLLEADELIEALCGLACRSSFVCTEAVTLMRP